MWREEVGRTVEDARSVLVQQLPHGCLLFLKAHEPLVPLAAPNPPPPDVLSEAGRAPLARVEREGTLIDLSCKLVQHLRGGWDEGILLGGG